MDKLNEVLKRLKRQYDAYSAERDSDDEEGMIDISVACSLADSAPYLIKKIEEQQKELEEAQELINKLYNRLGSSDSEDLKLWKETEAYCKAKHGTICLKGKQV